jgi:hypothetical protein
MHQFRVIEFNRLEKSGILLAWFDMQAKKPDSPPSSDRQAESD